MITHLLDREVFLYFEEAKRVLRPGGVGVFSFVDYALEREMFIKYVRDDSRRDLLTFFEKDTLRFFADASELEVVGFQDAGAPAPAKYPGQVPGCGETFTLGQSLAYLRA